MLLSEMLNNHPKKSKIKTVRVKKIRDLISGGECYTTMNGKTIYFFENGKWYTCMGKHSLNYNFIIIMEENYEALL